METALPDFRRYGLVGATASTCQVKAAWRLLAAAGEAGAFTVIGGPHPSSLPDESLAGGAVDCVVVGEGEETLAELASRIENGKGPEGLAGASWTGGGRAVTGLARPPLRDLDSLPFPAWEAFPRLEAYGNPQPLLSRLTPAFPLMTSRGCPYACSFCFKGVFGREWRTRSPASVLAEWEWLVRRHGAREIAVQDDSFNIDRDRALAICRLVAGAGFRAAWSTPNGIRADRVDAELLDAMRESGCVRVSFGVESGDQRILDALGKGETLDCMEKAFGLARKAGIRTTGFFMFGNLGEDERTMDATTSFAIRVDPFYAQFTMATPYPGTGLYDEVVRNGELVVRDWDHYGHYTARGFFRHGEVTPEGVALAIRRAYRRFYLRPRAVSRLLLDRGALGRLGEVVRGAFHLLGGM
jgi:radical SAM superfamily enzyme YgiQ (UPF0313 family)